MIENKEVIARNIKRRMEIKGVNSADVCRALGFKQNTFSNWINAKIYPRIDKIEKMANYFGISKADLVEPYPTIITANDRQTAKILEYAELLSNLSPESQALILDYIEYIKSKEA